MVEATASDPVNIDLVYWVPFALVLFVLKVVQAFFQITVSLVFFKDLYFVRHVPLVQLAFCNQVRRRVEVSTMENNGSRLNGLFIIKLTIDTTVTADYVVRFV